jgi:MFS family permease
MQLQLKSLLPQSVERQSGRLALAALSLPVLLASLGTSSANVALPELTKAFDLPFQSVQWVVLAYLLATTTLIVGAGRLGDLVGRRTLLQTGLFLFGTASAVCAAAPGLPVLIAARAAQGLGAAIMLALSLAFVGEIVPKEQTGRAMGVLGTTSALGTALGPSLSGALIAAFGWRAIFAINVPLAIAALALISRTLPADRARDAATVPSFDVPGTLLLAVALGSYSLSMTLGRGDFGFVNAGLLIAAAFGFVLFLGVESRLKAPLLRPAMLHEPVLRAGLTMSALVATVMMATLVVGPFYLSRALDLGSARVGLVMSIGPLVVAMTGVPIGRLVDRLGAGRLTVLGLVAMAIGAASLTLIPVSGGVAGYLIPIVIVTVGYASFQTANNTTVMADVRPDQRGVISGLLNLSRNVGLITGTAVMGALFARGAGSSEIASASASDVARGMHITFIAATVLIVAALAVAVKARTRDSATNDAPPSARR